MGFILKRRIISDRCTRPARHCGLVKPLHAAVKGLKPSILHQVAPHGTLRGGRGGAGAGWAPAAAAPAVGEAAESGVVPAAAAAMARAAAAATGAKRAERDARCILINQQID